LVISLNNPSLVVEDVAADDEIDGGDVQLWPLLPSSPITPSTTDAAANALSTSTAVGINENEVVMGAVASRACSPLVGDAPFNIARLRMAVIHLFA
jgi:hypothetical protein